MADVSYPDIIGEYINTPERFHTSGIQYVGYFEPAKIAPKQVAHLYLFMANTLNVPVTVTIQATMPRVGSGLFRSGKPVLQVGKPAVQLKMSEAEVGFLTLPVTTTEDVQTGEYLLTLEFKVATKTPGQRVRPTQGRCQLGEKSPIDDIVGLNLAGTLGATFQEKEIKKATFPLSIAGEPQASERAPRLGHTYETIWKQNQMETFNRAIHELNLRQVKLQNELTEEALYATLYGESVARFADVGLVLRVGEAITVAKMLTYTCRYFLGSSNRRNGLLVPMWERALETGMDTTDALRVIRTVGYYHLLKLAIAMAFGLIARAVGRQFWPLDERQAVIGYISDSIETGQSMDLEFLYLPLLIAGTLISNKVVLEDEDLGHSLALMHKAYQNRTDLFLDDDMEQASKIYHHIWKKTTQ